MNFRLGKNPPVYDARTLKLERYMGTLPVPPPEANFITKVPSFPMYANDTLGDCVAAAAGHMVQNWTCYAGKIATPTLADVIKFYEFSGYDPADPSTDQGWDLLAMMKKFRTDGLGGHKIEAFAQLTTGNWAQLKRAISTFGNVCIGFALPDAVVPEDPSADWTKIPWVWTPDMAPDSNNGHCVPAMAYSNNWVDFVSWAAKMGMNPEFYEECSDEAYVAITEDWIEADGKSPSGFDLAQLQADLAEVTA
jgi:hypothetical protein